MNEERMSVKSGNVQLNETVAGLIQSEKSDIFRSAVLLLKTEDVQMNNSSIGVLVSPEVHAGEIHTGVVLSRNVQGIIHTQLDTPRALLAGLACGAGFGLVLLLGRLVFKRR